MMEQAPTAEKFRITRNGVLLYLGICGLSTAINSFTSVVEHRRKGDTVIWEPVVWEGTSIFVLGLLAIAVYHLIARYPITSRNWPKHVLGHIMGGLVFSIIHTFAMVAWRKLIYLAVGQTYYFGDFFSNFLYELSKDVFTYATIVLYSVWVITRKNLNHEKMNALALKADLSALELRRLREQLRPHFLFNTLNLISSSMYEDVEKADRLMADLCTLLRHSLNEENLNTAPLSEEFRFLELYLSLLNQRFSGRLNIQIEKDLNTETAQIPRFLLQPLVENAVEHGFKSSGGSGTIQIRSLLKGDRLVLEVIDDGVGLQEQRSPSSGGLGLKNCRGILQQLYGDDFQLVLEPAEQGGVQAMVDIPYSQKHTVLTRRESDAHTHH